MREHVKILGILNIVMGSLTALGGLVVLLATGSIASLIVMGLQDSGDADGARFAAPLVGVIGSIIGIFLLALALPAILGGWGLLNYKSWSRILMIVMVAQAGVGYTQYFTHLPALLVEVHILGVTALVIGATRTFLACTYHAPEMLPAPVVLDRPEPSVAIGAH